MIDIDLLVIHQRSFLRFSFGWFNNIQCPNPKAIASFLQRQLNSVSAKLKVKNLGVSWASSKCRLDLIEANENFDVDDILVLYFGVNDTFLPTQFREKINSLDLIFMTLNGIIELFRNTSSKSFNLSYASQCLCEICWKRKLHIRRLPLSVVCTQSV